MNHSVLLQLYLKNAFMISPYNTIKLRKWQVKNPPEYQTGDKP